MARLAQQPTDRITVGHLHDDSLIRLERQYRRVVEDIADGVLPAARGPVARAQHADVVAEMRLREALRGSWGAVDGGCESYTDFMAAGGLPAVAAGAGRPVGYALAIQLDRAQFLAGRPYVLAWPDGQARGTWAGVAGMLLCPAGADEPDTGVA